jgi:hypothetical protein
MSVALSGVGDAALIGDDPLFPGVVATGSLFQRSRSSWARSALRLTCGGEGCAVALSGDASTALVGTTVYVNTAK